MDRSDSIKELVCALLGFHKDKTAIVKDSKSHHGKYADLHTILTDIDGPLLAHGLVVMQFAINEGESIGIKTVLAHKSGEFLSDQILLPISGIPNKNIAQAAGSLLTYLRRYSLSAVLSLSATDDDGDSLTPKEVKKPVKDDTYSRLVDLIRARKLESSVKEWCQSERVERLSELSPSILQLMINKIESGELK